jgi:hypothetical protein
MSYSECVRAIDTCAAAEDVEGLFEIVLYFSVYSPCGVDLISARS